METRRWPIVAGVVAVAVVVALVALFVGGSDDQPVSTDATTTAADRSSASTLYAGLKVHSGSESTGEMAIAAIDPEGGGLRRLATIDAEDDWTVSPDGEAVAVSTSRTSPAHLRVVDTTTTAVRWEQPMGNWTEFPPLWSHDGQSVAVVRGVRDESDAGHRTDLVVLDADDGTPTLTVDVPPTEDGFGMFLAWSADDRQLAVGVPPRLLRVDDGTEVRSPLPVEDRPSMLVWSPSGDHVLRSGLGDLTIWSVDGGEEVQLGAGSPFAWEPWSPDGSHLAYLAFDPDGDRTAEVVVVDVTGESRRSLLTASGIEDLLEALGELPLAWAWSPDGTELAILESHRITIHPIDGGPPRELTVLDVDEGEFTGRFLAWREVTAGGDPIELPAVEELGPAGSLEAVDAATGATLWTTELPGQPLEHTGVAAAGTIVAVAVGREGATQAIAGVDQRTGELTWTSPAERIGWIDGGDDSFVVATGQGLVSIGASDGARRSEPGVMAEVWDHVLAPSTVVVARSVPVALTAFDLANGAQQWTTELCEQCVADRLGVGPDLVVVAMTAHSLEGEMSSVAAVDQTTGTLRWEEELYDGCQVRAVATTGSVVLVLTGDRLIALDSATGAVQWTTDVAGGSRLAAAGGRVFVIGDVLTAIDVMTGEMAWQEPSGYGLVADDDVVVTVAHYPDPGGRQAVVGRDVATGAKLWERFVSTRPLEVALASGVLTYALPAEPPPPDPTPDPGPAPLLVVDGWRYTDGSREEYGFTRDDGAVLDSWSTPITDLHDLESYVEDRRAESREDPAEVTVDGYAARLFSYGPTRWEALWERAGHVQAIRTRTEHLTEDQFLVMLASVRHVTDAEWEEAHGLPAPPASD